MVIVAQVTCLCNGPAHDVSVVLLTQVRTAIRGVRWTVDDARLEAETGLATVQFRGTATADTIDPEAVADTLNAEIDVGLWSVAIAE